MRATAFEGNQAKLPGCCVCVRPGTITRSRSAMSSSTLSGASGALFGSARDLARHHSRTHWELLHPRTVVGHPVNQFVRGSAELLGLHRYSLENCHDRGSEPESLPA